MSLLPFGSAPTPLATQTRAGKVTLAQIPNPIYIRIATGRTVVVPDGQAMLVVEGLKLEGTAHLILEGDSVLYGV